MKINFYDLFSHYVPDDFSETGGENYFTAAIKGRVIDNISENAVQKKSRRIRKLHKVIFAAAAAVVVLITGTLAASAMGLIDLEKVFGFMFNSGFNNLDNITAIPQNVVTTGDDRLSMRVLGIGGTENEAFGIIEIKRNDGGSFPENIRAIVQRDSMTYADSGRKVTYMGGVGISEAIDDTTAICRFRVFNNSDETIIGSIYKITIIDITDVDVFNELYAAEEAENPNFCSVDALALWDKSVVLRGEWSISFPLEYSADCRTLNVEEEFKNEAMSGMLTEVRYSAVSVDIIVKNIEGEFIGKPREPIFDPCNNIPLKIKLSNGTDIDVQPTSAGIGLSSYNEDQNEYQYDMHLHYKLDDIIDIDSVKKIIVEDTVIKVK